MLVLLVIFMVTAPLINPGSIDLPSVGSKLTVPAAPMEVTLNTDLTLTLVDRQAATPPVKVSLDELVARIRAKQVAPSRSAGRHRRGRQHALRRSHQGARSAPDGRRAQGRIAGAARRRQLKSADGQGPPPATRAHVGPMAGAGAGDRRARRLHRGARLLVALAESQTRAGDGRALRAPVQDGGRAVAAPPRSRSPPPPPKPEPVPEPKASRSPGQPRRPRRNHRRRRSRRSPSPRSKSPIPARPKSRRRPGRTRRSARSASRRRGRRASARRRKPTSGKPKGRSGTSSSVWPKRASGRRAKRKRCARRPNESRRRAHSSRRRTRRRQPGRAPRRTTSAASRARSRATSSCRRTWPATPKPSSM